MSWQHIGPQLKQFLEGTRQEIEMETNYRQFTNAKITQVYPPEDKSKPDKPPWWWQAFYVQGEGMDKGVRVSYKLDDSNPHPGITEGATVNVVAHQNGNFLNIDPNQYPESGVFAAGNGTPVAETAPQPTQTGHESTQNGKMTVSEYRQSQKEAFSHYLGTITEVIGRELEPVEYAAVIQVASAKATSEAIAILRGDIDDIPF